MNAFFNSLRADLLDRRMRPLLALIALALIGAVVYAVTAGSGSSTPPATGSASPANRSSGIAVSAVQPESAKALAETTAGTAQQTNGGKTHNPFTPLPQAKASGAAATTRTGAGVGVGAASNPSSGSTSSSGSGSTSASGSKSESSAPGNGSAPSKSKSKPKPSRPQAVYDVSILFGAVAPGTPVTNAQLTPYEKLELQQPLPSPTQALVVFRGVIAGGKSATFTLVGEAILRGSAVCRPSAAQCQTIDLQVGQAEELEYAPPGAAPTTYVLQIVAIKAVGAKAAAARRAVARQSKVGLRLLRNSGLDALPGLRYSGAAGVLVFAGHRAYDARAHLAALHVLGSAPQGLSASK